MKKTELYRKTTEDLADARTQEKRRRGIFIVLVIIAILLGLIWKGGIPLPVYFILGAISGLILWYNNPWERVSSEEVAESEILYFLSMKLRLDEEQIQNLNQNVGDLYDNLPGDKAGFIQGKREILALDEKILDLHQEILEINDTFGIENDPVMLEDLERVREEILSLKKDLK